MEQTRINKYLAQCGICSRREADRLIEQGRVKINGRTACAGDQVTEADQVAVGGKLLGGRRKTVVLAYHKPEGVTCTERDPHAKRTIKDMVHYSERVTYAGRLDRDSEGLLLLTNDGDLIDAMMRGANRHEKEYIVKVDQELTQDFAGKMSEGVYLKELSVRTRPCQVEVLGKYTFRIILTQGLNRQIRRMCQCFGYEVKRLVRVRIMNIELGPLKKGELRELKGKELETLYEQCGLKKEGTEY